MLLRSRPDMCTNLYIRFWVVYWRDRLSLVCSSERKYTDGTHNTSLHWCNKYIEGERERERERERVLCVQRQSDIFWLLYYYSIILCYWKFQNPISLIQLQIFCQDIQTRNKYNNNYNFNYAGLFNKKSCFDSRELYLNNTRNKLWETQKKNNWDSVSSNISSNATQDTESVERWRWLYITVFFIRRAFRC